MYDHMQHDPYVSCMLTWCMISTYLHVWSHGSALMPTCHDHIQTDPCAYHAWLHSNGTCPHGYLPCMIHGTCAFPVTYVNILCDMCPMYDHMVQPYAYHVWSHNTCPYLMFNHTHDSCICLDYVWLCDLCTSPVFHVTITVQTPASVVYCHHYMAPTPFSTMGRIWYLAPAHFSCMSTLHGPEFIMYDFTLHALVPNSSMYAHTMWSPHLSLPCMITWYMTPYPSCNMITWPLHLSLCIITQYISPHLSCNITVHVPHTYHVTWSHNTWPYACHVTVTLWCQFLCLQGLLVPLTFWNTTKRWF